MHGYTGRKISSTDLQLRGTVDNSIITDLLSERDSLSLYDLQNEQYREEFLNERKEKERVLSLKDKLKRDLENAQSRISSLQEQVRLTLSSVEFECGIASTNMHEIC